MIISLQEASSILYSISEKVESKLIGTTTQPDLRIEKHETIQLTELGKIIAIDSPVLILNFLKHFTKLEVSKFNCLYVICSF